MFKFHFNNGDSLTIAGKNWKDAIKRFQQMLPGVAFTTDPEYKINYNTKIEKAIKGA